MILSVILQFGGGGKGGGMTEMIIFMVALFAIMYFFMIRPQQKKQKAAQAARQALKVGDRVVTAGGIHGKIKDIKDSTFLIEISDGVRIKIEKTSVQPAGTPVEETPEASK